jgi:uncharacterized protein YggE
MKRVLFFLLSFPISAFAEGGLPNQPYLYVEGKAEIEKPADMVTLRFDVVARAPEQKKANEEVQAKATNIFSLLNSRKIAETDVIAQNVRSEPQFQEDESPRRYHGKLIGYSVTRSFEVKLRDVTIFPKLVDELLAINDLEISGVDQGLSKEKQMQDEIWKKALTNARDRAEKTLKEIGMKIDSVFAVSPVPIPDIKGAILQGRGGRAERVLVTAATEYRLAPVSLSQSVHVIYLISPAK